MLLPHQPIAALAEQPPEQSIPVCAHLMPSALSLSDNGWCCSGFYFIVHLSPILWLGKYDWSLR